MSLLVTRLVGIESYNVKAVSVEVFAPCQNDETFHAVIVKVDSVCSIAKFYNRVRIQRRGIVWTRKDHEHKKTPKPHCPSLGVDQLFLIHDPQPIIACVRLDGWLIHQFRACWRDAKFAGHLDAHGILERRVAIKIVLEDDRAVVAKLAVA